MMKSNDGRYEIRLVSSSDHWGLHDRDWLVVELKTNRVVASFSDPLDGSASGAPGPRMVSFTGDGKHIKVEHYAKPDEIFPIETPDKSLKEV